VRYTIQYIPINKIIPDETCKMTPHLRKLRHVMWDGAHLLVVRKNRKNGCYTILAGHDRYRFLRKHTNKLFAPCLVDESKLKSRVGTWLYRFRNRRLLKHFPDFSTSRITPAGLAIVRAFLKEEPRFKRLTRPQQIKVLLLAVRYKKTVVRSMKARVDQYCAR